MEPIFRYMIEAASAAYSPQNAQAWRFLRANDRLLVRPDFPRLFPTADPRHRGGWVSLGAASENAALAAMLAGFDAAVSFDAQGEWPVAVQVLAGPPSVRADVHLADQIPLRRTHRGRMTGPALNPAEVAAAGRAALPGARVVRTEPRDRIAVLDVVENAVRTQLRDRRVRRELHRYHRLWPWQAADADDGLVAENLGMRPLAATAVAVATLPGVVSMIGMADRLAHQARRICDTSPDFLLFVGASDDPAGWFEGGRGWQRAALALCAAGVATHALTGPLDVPDTAAALRRMCAVPAVEGLVALVRAGRAEVAPPPTRRRAVEDFVDRVPGLNTAH